MSLQKNFFTRHAKSSAAFVTLVVHAALIIIAIFFVAVTVIRKGEVDFEATPVSRPRMNLKKLQVPVNAKQPPQQPKLRQQIVVKPNVSKIVPDLKMPEIVGVKGGLGTGGGGFGKGLSLGFTMPELDFFGAKAKGEKIVFVVHFGPATIASGNQDGSSTYTPFSRLTGLTIRNRLEDLVDSLPEYAMFNVIAYFAGDAWAFEPNIMQATPANKQKLKEWMAPVNPLEGDYEHCFSKKPQSVVRAARNYPTLVDKLPFYATKWCYPYVVPKDIEQKYIPDAPNGFMHWGRGVVWALLEQKPDTIFVLTTNYIDGWEQRASEDDSQPREPPQPQKMGEALQAICRDVYGPDEKNWPTINVVVLAKAGKDPTGAYKVLNNEYGPIWRGFDSEGSVIEDIKDYMTRDEQDLYYKYKSEYGIK